MDDGKKQDYYEILGVANGADEAALKGAYRKLAMQFHPDRNPGNADAEAKFKEISEAYDTLKDPQKRAAYDRFGFADPAAPSPGARPAAGGVSPGAAAFFDGLEEMLGGAKPFGFGSAWTGFRGAQSETTSRGAHFADLAKVTAADIDAALIKEGYLTSGIARDLAALYVQKPELVAPTANRVLRLMAQNSGVDKKSDILGAIQTVLGKRDAAANKNLLDGVTNLALMASLADVPGAIDAAHLQAALKDRMALHAITIDNLNTIYDKHPALIAATATDAFRLCGNEYNQRELAAYLARQHNAGKTALNPSLLDHTTSLHVLEKFTAIPGFVRPEDITKALALSSPTSETVEMITRLYAQAPDLIQDTAVPALERFKRAPDYMNRLLQTIGAQVQAGNAVFDAAHLGQDISHTYSKHLRAYGLAAPQRGILGGLFGGSAPRHTQG